MRWPRTTRRSAPRASRNGRRRSGRARADAMAASPARPAADTEARRARVAVFGLFFVNAVLYANLVPRYPEVRARLDLSNAALGTAIAAMPAGALLAGLFAPRLIRRFGSGPIASAGLVALGAAIAAVPVAP